MKAIARLHKAKKPHICSACNSPINEGETYVSVVFPVGFGYKKFGKSFHENCIASDVVDVAMKAPRKLAKKYTCLEVLTKKAPKKTARQLTKTHCEEVVPAITTQAEAIAWLKQKCPDFFSDPDLRDISAVILMELGEDIADIKGLTPTRLVSLLAGIQTLLYKFGAAAIASTNGGKKMTRRFVEKYAEDNPDKIQELNPSHLMDGGTPSMQV